VNIKQCLVGTILNEDKENGTRTYFTTEPEKWVFKRLMFRDGWSIKSEKYCEYKNVFGFEIVLKSEAVNK